MYKLIKPLLFALNPEKMHDIAVNAGKAISNTMLMDEIDFFFNKYYKILETDTLDLRFQNPVGLAAGFDKNGELLDIIRSLGFGFCEIGSVSAQVCMGNKKPRLFRLPGEQAIINNMGLNNHGADRIAEGIRAKSIDIPLGVNIAKTNDYNITGDATIKDFCDSFSRMYSFADYIALNISCPNTKEGRTFEDSKILDELLFAVLDKRDCLEKQGQGRKPVLVKLSPDLGWGELDRILRICADYNIDGYIAGNTSSDRNILRTAKGRARYISGGISGLPLRERSIDLVRHAYHFFDGKDKGSRPAIIGCGGIFSAQDAYDKIKAGASLVQLYTGLIYEGPGVVKRIKKGLAQMLERDGFSSVDEAVGTEGKG